jgi:hypothetical protein
MLPVVQRRALIRLASLEEQRGSPTLPSVHGSALPMARISTRPPGVGCAALSMSQLMLPACHPPRRPS